MRFRESKEEKARKFQLAKKNLEKTPPEKNDILAMIIAGFLVFLPVLLIVLALFWVVIKWLFL